MCTFEGRVKKKRKRIKITYLRPLEDLNLDFFVPTVANAVLVAGQTQVSNVPASPVLHAADLLNQDVIYHNVHNRVIDQRSSTLA